MNLSFGQRVTVFILLSLTPYPEALISQVTKTELPYLNGDFKHQSISIDLGMYWNDLNAKESTTVFQEQGLSTVRKSTDNDISFIRGTKSIDSGTILTLELAFRKDEAFAYKVRTNSLMTNIGCLDRKVSVYMPNYHSKQSLFDDQLTAINSFLLKAGFSEQLSTLRNFNVSRTFFDLGEKVVYTVAINDFENPRCFYDLMLEKVHVSREKSILISGIDLTDERTADPEIIIQAFLDEVKRIGLSQKQEVLISFSPIDSQVLAQCLSMYQDNLVTIEINPEHWQRSSSQKKWYILYHELGHDVLNIEHTGIECRMMQPISDREYSWDEFLEDRSEMFLFWLKQ